MNLIIDLDNTLIFKDTHSSYDKVYIDLLEKDDGSLGIMCRKTLSNLKKFCESKNKLIFFSNKNKEYFDNINLSIHGVKSYLEVLSFGYEIYKNDKLDLDWLSFINECRYKNKEVLDDFNKFIMEELPNELINKTEYGYFIKKDDLFHDFDFINYDYLRYYLNKYQIVKVFEDDYNIYLVMEIFNNNELYNYIECVYFLDELSCVVCTNSSFFIDLMLEFQSHGILNFNTENTIDFEEYLLINDLDNLLNDLIFGNIYILNGKELSIGEEIMYRVFEIFIESL